MTSRLTRRQFLRRSGRAGAAVAAAMTIGRARAAAPATSRPHPPNIVFIMTDDQRADALSLAGH